MCTHHQMYRRSTCFQDTWGSSLRHLSKDADGAAGYWTRSRLQVWLPAHSVARFAKEQKPRAAALDRLRAFLAYSNAMRRRTQGFWIQVFCWYGSQRRDEVLFCQCLNFVSTPSIRWPNRKWTIPSELQFSLFSKASASSAHSCYSHSL